ncbi:MAG TPA: hypothetical protein PKD83_01250 [Ignavibacteria bacterium]|nr:hypothetical protein [Ignavibacteria bacterium]
MISYRISFVLILVLFLNINNSYSQFDSSKIKIGPEELLSGRGGMYFNFADKNKVNFEVTIIGGVGTGRYLIPKGTTVFDLLLMSGGTIRTQVDDVKLVRFESDTPQLKINEVIQLDFSTIYSEDVKDIKKGNSNPVLKPGDMLIVPVLKTPPPGFWATVITIMSYVTTLISFYYVVSNVYRDYNR